MPSFSQRSLDRLKTCHPDLRRLFSSVVVKFDCTILQGVRTDEEQAELYRQGRTKLDGVTKRSKHQARADGLSYAVDVVCYPIDWNVSDEAVAARWLAFARAVFAEAERQGISLRWGGDWNRNWNWRDPDEDPRADAAQRFNDWPHFEVC